MNDEEKRKYEAFQYWIQTNTERGVTAIPDNLCLFVVNLIEKLQKGNEELKEDRDKFKKELLKRITYCNELEKDLFENCSKYVIPIQKIKDKIEEYKNMLKTCNKVKDIDRIKAINERIRKHKLIRHIKKKRKSSTNK